MTAILPVYNRCDLQFERGEGAYLFTAKGEEYLDFAAGIAVNSLGHAHPKANEALIKQARKLWHVSNLYHIEGLEKFAGKLVKNSFADKVFFCNSGAEAVEAGIKMIRKYQDGIGRPERFHVITFRGSFHGRTLATISASAQEKNLKGFLPAVEGFVNLPYNDIVAVKKAISKNKKIGGILVEPILGEGGIVNADPKFLKALRKIADDNDLVLMFDEVQTGMGRTGKLFAYEWFDVKPDVLSSAKGIGNGFPLGACLVNDRVAKYMTTGSHGSTYGSNPLAMAVGNAVIDVILGKGFLKNVQTVSEHLEKGLEGIKQSFPDLVLEVRGMGLMRGIKFAKDSKIMVDKLRDFGLLSVPAADNVVRLLPPLIIGKEHVDEAIQKIRKACREIENE